MVRWRRLNGGCFPLCHCERKSHPAPVDFQGLCFSLVLWQQPQPFLLVFPKLVKQFKLLPSIHWSTELWSRVLLLKTTSTNTTPFAYNRLLFLVFIFFVVSRLPPTFSFPSEPWMGRSVSGLALLSFSQAFAPELLGCETNLPTMGSLPLCVQFNRCWHVGGYPWVKIRFPCLLLTPHWSHSLCVRLGVKSSSVWSSACGALLCSPFALPHRMLFWNADIIET